MLCRDLGPDIICQHGLGCHPMPSSSKYTYQSHYKNPNNPGVVRVRYTPTTILQFQYKCLDNSEDSAKAAQNDAHGRNINDASYLYQELFGFKKKHTVSNLSFYNFIGGYGGMMQVSPTRDSELQDILLALTPLTRKGHYSI